MADRTYIGDFNLPDTHVERAIDELHAHLLTVTDNNGETLIKSAELMRYSEQSIRKPNTPYAITRIVNVVEDNEQNELVIARSEIELVTDLVFQAAGDDDVQRLGFRLARAIWKALQPIDDINPEGFDIADNAAGAKWWGFLTDNDFASKQKRTVTRLDEAGAALSGSYYTIPLQYKIEVYPMMSYD